MEQLVVITGLSGSGKSLAARCFEDLGYFCVDNLPVALIPRFYELIHLSAEQIHRAALVIDVREGRFLEQLPAALAHLKRAGAPVCLLFFECSDEVLKRRFSESRRPHPVVGAQGSLEDGIRKERQALAMLRDRADRIIDTSRYSAHELRMFLHNAFGAVGAGEMNVNVVSFGFKYGLPPEADLVFDVRFLPNPYFVEELRGKDGTRPEVRDYLDDRPETKAFMERLRDFVDFLVPLYTAEGKSYLTITLGCTGGKHRSVALAEQIREHLTAKGQSVTVTHRDLGRE